MAYGINSPFGLRPYGHLISGVNDIKVSKNYTISNYSLSLNKGDPVMITPGIAQYVVGSTNNGYQGGQGEIMLYNPAVTLEATNNNTVINMQGSVTNTVSLQPIVGVFQGCEYYMPNGTFVAQEYWQAGTITNGKPVIASIIEDPYVVYDIQLSTYCGALFSSLTNFSVLPCLQVEAASAGWPNTGVAAAVAGTPSNSCVIGSNIALLTGNNVGAIGTANATASLSAVTSWNGSGTAVAGYADNPLIANQGTSTGNPWGVSTFYACPSTAVRAGTPASAIDGSCEYLRTATTALTVLGFTPDPRNVPATYGYPANVATAGTYFNTPFLNVLVVINNHAKKAGNIGTTIVV